LFEELISPLSLSRAISIAIYQESRLVYFFFVSSGCACFSMLFACSLQVLGAESFQKNMICSTFWAANFHVACCLQHLGAGTFLLLCYLQHFGAEIFYFEGF